MRSSINVEEIPLVDDLPPPASKASHSQNVPTQHSLTTTSSTNTATTSTSSTLTSAHPTDSNNTVSQSTLQGEENAGYDVEDEDESARWNDTLHSENSTQSGDANHKTTSEQVNQDGEETVDVHHDTTESNIKVTDEETLTQVVEKMSILPHPCNDTKSEPVSLPKVIDGDKLMLSDASETPEPRDEKTVPADIDDQMDKVGDPV